MMSLRSFSVLIALSITIGLSACGVQRSNFVNNQGVEKARHKDWNGAITDYSEAIRLNPNHAIAYYNRGLAYGQLGEYQKALTDHTEAIRLNPSYADAYNDRGNTYNWLKESQKAIADFDQALRLNPNNAIAYFNRATAYNNLKESQKAIADYTQALSLDPNLVDAYFNRGIVHNRLGESQQAIADYTEAIRLNPKLADAYNKRGDTYYWLKKYQKALTDYEQAIRLNPNLKQVIGSRLPSRLPLPKNGYGVYKFNRGATSSTLKIIPSQGTENLVIKLENTSTKKEICWFLIVKGNSHKMPIPPGSYIIKLAMGERWYGDKYLFGTQGSYSKIDQEITIPEYTNYTIFLEPNLLGTLTQQKIEANEF